MAKSPAMPPPIWKNPAEGRPSDSPLLARYHSMRFWNCSVPVFTHWWWGTFPLRTLAENMFPVVESSQPGAHTGMPFSMAASIQESPGSIW